MCVSPFACRAADTNESLGSCCRQACLLGSVNFPTLITNTVLGSHADCFPFFLHLFLIVLCCCPLHPNASAQLSPAELLFGEGLEPLKG